MRQLVARVEWGDYRLQSSSRSDGVESRDRRHDCNVRRFTAIAGIVAHESWDSARKRTEDQAVAASKIVATNAKWIDALAWQALQRIDESPGPDVGVADKAKVRDINEAVENLPGQAEAYVVDRDGATILSPDPEVKPIAITDRPHFSELKKRRSAACFETARQQTKWEADFRLEPPC